MHVPSVSEWRFCASAFALGWRILGSKTLTFCERQNDLDFGSMSMYKAIGLTTTGQIENQTLSHVCALLAGQILNPLDFFDEG
jgi:hypothetical protein